MLRNKTGVHLAAALGAGALMLGIAGMTPAHADDWENYGRNHVYRDISDVRRDERLLRDLQERHDEARHHHDWDRMHALDRRISELRRHIDQDRRDIRADVRRNRDRYNDAGYHTDDRYHDSDRYRNGDRYNSSDRYRNGDHDRYDR